MNDLIDYMNMTSSLSPQCRMILNHVKRVGYITVRAAVMDYGIGSLSRRMVDLQEAGFSVNTERRKNPATGQRYVRYYVSAQRMAA